jgi:hypothetical protein
MPYQPIQFCCHLLFCFQQQWKHSISLLFSLLGRIRLFSLLPLSTKMVFSTLEGHPPDDLQTKCSMRLLPVKEQQQKLGLSLSAQVIHKNMFCKDALTDRGQLQPQHHPQEQKQRTHRAATKAYISSCFVPSDTKLFI